MPPQTSAQRRAVLYGRQSKLARRRKAQPDDEQVSPKTSVDRQLAKLTSQARQEAVEIAGVFRDDGISASRFANGKAREGWEQTMELLLSGAVTELWTREISRATRDRPVWATLINACIARRILICVDGKLHDPCDPDDGFMLDLQAALAVRESAVTSKRIQLDVAARVVEGKPHGKVPYGYRRVYDERTGDLLRQETDPLTAPIVGEMARRVLDGEPFYRIAQDLERRGVPSPEAWRIKRVTGELPEGMGWRGDEVRDQVVSPTPAGLRTHNGVVVGPATWPAIISAADHAALVQKLTGPDRPGWFGPAKHLLTGIVVCGVCGATTRRTKNRGYYSYSCKGRDLRGASCVACLQAPLDAMVTMRVIGRLEDPGLLEDIARARSGHDERAAQASRDLADLRARLAEWEASAATPGGISPARLARIEADIETKMLEAQARLAEAQPMPEAVLSLAGPDAAQKWQAISKDVGRKRQVIRALVRVVLHPSRRPPGTKGWDPSRVEITPI